MKVLLAVLVAIALFGLMLFIDNKVKSNKSIIVKIGSLILFAAMILGYAFIYERVGLSLNFSIESKFLDRFSELFNSRIITVVYALLIWIFAFLKVTFVTLHFSISRVFKHNEKAVKIVSIVFDIAVIPNIILFAGNTVIFVATIGYLVIEMGLACYKLVFSIRNKNVVEARA